MENNAIRNGVYMGVASILYSLIITYTNPSMFASFWNSMIGFALYIIFMCMAVAADRRENGGFISFGEALKTSFLAFVVGSLIATLFSYILMNYINPGLMDTIKEAQIAAVEGMSGMLGEEGVEKALEALEEQELSFDVGTMAVGYLFNLIFGLILALIISAIMKKNNPNEMAMG